MFKMLIKLEQVAGFGPAYLPWQGSVITNYTIPAFWHQRYESNALPRDLESRPGPSEIKVPLMYIGAR